MKSPVSLKNDVFFIFCGRSDFVLCVSRLFSQKQQEAFPTQFKT